MQVERSSGTGGVARISTTCMLLCKQETVLQQGLNEKQCSRGGNT